ncbi:MAG TPA: MFS transporter [Devosiaceae bacterium]|jgi:predicted MFS family arabinose efflux permease
MAEHAANGAGGAEQGPSPALLSVVGIATGALVANLYYAQPLLAAIGPEIGIRPDLAGTVVSTTQVGYGLGLLLLVSLADLVENKRLVLTLLVGTVLALVAAASSNQAIVFFIASFVIGVCSTGAQVLIPFVVHLVPPERRGRTVGNVMSGLLTGIMLARPLALFIAAALSWRSVFWLSAVVMIAIGLLLGRMMPRYQPAGGVNYGRNLVSMVGLLRNTPVLQRRAAYQALMFGAFNMFWTAVPLMLADRFGLSQQGIAFFALAGAGGALAAPLAGRLADRGWIQATTFGSMALLGLCFYGTSWAEAGGALAVLVVLTIILDASVQGNQVVSQRLIFSLPAEIRGRLNALYMTFTFLGGAVGSTIGAASYHWGGWNATATIGGLIGVAMLMLFATELRKPRVSKAA